MALPPKTEFLQVREEFSKYLVFTVNHFMTDIAGFFLPNSFYNITFLFFENSIHV